MYKPKLIIHFPCRGHIYQLFSNGTVECDGKHYETLIRDGKAWTPKRDTFLSMCRLWSNEWGLPGTIRKDAVVNAAIIREQIEEMAGINASH